MPKLFKEHNDVIKISITDECINCKKCITACPTGVITYNYDNQQKKPAILNQSLCIGCGHCIAVCPKDAIIHNKLPLENFTDIRDFEKITWDQFINFTRQRRSIRKFLNKPVSGDLIEKILNESARYSPSGHNRQMTKVSILEGDILKDLREEMNKTILRLHKYLKILRFFSSKLKLEWENMCTFKNMIDQGMDPSTRDAPMAMIFLANKHIKESEVDAAIMSYQSLLSAEILGLRTCYFGALINMLPYSGKLKKMLKLQSNDKVCCGLLIGYSNIGYKKNVFRKKVEYSDLK